MFMEGAGVPGVTDGGPGGRVGAPAWTSPALDHRQNLVHFKPGEDNIDLTLDHNRINKPSRMLGVSSMHPF